MRAAGQCGRGRDADLLSAAAASAGAGDRVEGPPVGRHPLLDQLPVKLETCVGTVSAPVCNNGLIVRRDVEHQPLRPVLLERTHRRVCSRDILLLRVRARASAATRRATNAARGRRTSASSIEVMLPPRRRCGARRAREGGTQGMRATAAAHGLTVPPETLGRGLAAENVMRSTAQRPRPRHDPRAAGGRPAHSSKLMFPPKNKQNKSTNE